MTQRFSLLFVAVLFAVFCVGENIGWAQPQLQSKSVAQSQADAITEVEIPKVVVLPEQKTTNRLKPYETVRVQEVPRKDISRNQSTVVTDVLEQQAGLEVETVCAFCGSKRITINGLKGEHTTLLTDGLSLHTSTSSFYGLDLLPTVALESIDVYRGSGAALSAPESIGGAIDLKTLDIVSSQTKYRLGYSEDGSNSAQLLKAHRQGSWGALIAVSLGKTTAVDTDQNEIAEIPQQTPRAVMGKLQWQSQNESKYSLRLSTMDLKTLGGYQNSAEIQQVAASAPEPGDFDLGDVRKKYIGDPQRIQDSISVKRTELGFIADQPLNSSLSLKSGVGFASQDLSTIYSHGYDYAHQEKLLTARSGLQWAGLDRHLLAVNLDLKQQTLDSRSKVLFDDKNLPSDSLKSSLYGLSIQDTYTASEKMEVAVALKLDQTQVKWTSFNKSVDKTLLSPRLFLKHNHNEVLSSRFGYGKGYRLPLTLLESQHGTHDDGFVIDIDRPETSESFYYSLAGQRLDDFFELSVHQTRLQGMAYGEDRTQVSLPTRFINLDEDFSIQNYELRLGRRWAHHYTVEVVLEKFVYPNSYKIKLPVAATEDQVTIQGNYEGEQWKVFSQAQWVGSRDLTKYGYDKHFNVANDDILSPDFGLSRPKRGQAPAFWTMNVGFEYEFRSQLKLGLSVQNIFDYTQARTAEDSPLTWAEHGNHYHLDNLHLWGPNRGRQISLNLSGFWD